MQFPTQHNPSPRGGAEERRGEERKELTNRTFQDFTVVWANVDCVGCVFILISPRSYCSVQKRLPPYIQSLVDLISESLSSDSASQFPPAPTTDMLPQNFPSPLSEFSFSQLLNSPRRRGTRGQRLITANNPISQRLPLTDTVWSWVGPLPIPLSAYPQEHSELNQTLISPLLWW